MLGVKFRISNKYDTVLFKIFKNFDFKNYIVKIIEEEVLDEHNLEFFKQYTYNGLEFEKTINSKKYYPIFLNLHLYYNDNNEMEINNYNDFLNSNCQFILFITDNEFVEIYAKNEKELSLINNNVIVNQFESIEYINDISNVRKNFTAY